MDEQGAEKRQQALIRPGFKRLAQETPRANLADEGDVQAAAKVNELLGAIKQKGYFFSWIIREFRGSAKEGGE